ncbi:MAG TPA: hypothetical protein VGD60_20330 [Candidatus Acidoferrales bacterium]
MKSYTKNALQTLHMNVKRLAITALTKDAAPIDILNACSSALDAAGREAIDVRQFLPHRKLQIVRRIPAVARRTESNLPLAS